MDNLWAPWRMSYILSDKDTGCFLCSIISTDHDQENYVLKRGATCVALLNRYPYNNGHIMVVPRRHVANLEDLTREEKVELIDLSSEMILALRRAMNPHGFNVGLNLGSAAGAGLKDHLHQHIVPRWQGDTNFMPAVGGVKVIPQTLDSVRDQLKRALAKV